jgi:signal transduction histidine kinase
MVLQAAQAAQAGQLVDNKVLFIVAVLVIVSVVVFATAVIFTLLRRSDRRRAEEEKLAAIGTATARILHQIKNPLQTIVLHADILQDERIVSEQHQRREVCEAIVGESGRLVAMLDELSVYASGARTSWCGRWPRWKRARRWRRG